MGFLYIILLIITCSMIFIGKSVADIVSNKTNWRQSIFKKWGDEGSFWGHKAATSSRKDHKNKILNFLFHNPLVFLTDVWHLANTIRRIGIYLSITIAILLGSVMTINLSSLFWIMSSFILLNIIGFHIFYHYILRIKKTEE